MSYIAKVDPNECSAHGDCVDVAPQVFRPDNVAEVIDSETGETVFP
jgi:ferredoxin